MTLTFREDGYFNMTMAAKAFGKRLDNFTTSPETKEYIAALSSTLESSDLLIKIPGNRYIPNRGTWAHPKLVVFFARWLDVRFAVACDQMIEEILKGNATVTKTVAPTTRVNRSSTDDARVGGLIKAVPVGFDGGWTVARQNTFYEDSHLFGDVQLPLTCEEEARSIRAHL